MVTRAVCGDVQGVAGAVVEPGDDLGVGAGSAVGVGEPVVGEVGLPGLVGHRGLEPDVGGLRSLLRLGGDQPGAGQVAADGGLDTRCPWWCARCQAMVSGPASRPASVSSLRTRTIRSTSLGRQGGRGGLGASGAGLERGLALGLVAGLELVDPGTVHAVSGGDLGGGLVVDEEGGDDQAGFRHGRASSPARVSPMTCDRCRLCLETSVADVLNQHTVSPTEKPALTSGSAGSEPVLHLNPKPLFRTYSASIRERAVTQLSSGRASSSSTWATSAAMAGFEM